MKSWKNILRKFPQKIQNLNDFLCEQPPRVFWSIIALKLQWEMLK